MTVVVDASAVVAMLVDGGPVGNWAARILREKRLAAPQLMPIEVTNVLRRAAASGDISQDVASQAFADLMELRVALFPFEHLAERVWELRNAVTAYDACYVALSEALDASLVTVDRRLVTAPGPACTFITPGA